MPEVEDVTRDSGIDGAATVLDDVAHGALDDRPTREQDDRVQVALQRDARPDPRGGIGQRGAPVHSDDG